MKPLAMNIITATFMHEQASERLLKEHEIIEIK